VLLITSARFSMLRFDPFPVWTHMTAFDSFKEVQKMVETAKASWAIWFQLYSFEMGGHKFALPIQLHHPLFSAISEASRHLTIMNLDALFKGRNDTHSFSNLLEMCEGRLMPRQAQRCKAKIASLKPLVKGIGKLRGNYFGHRIRTKKTEEFFKDAGLKIKDVDELADAAYWLLWQLACAFIPNDPDITTDIEQSVKGSLDDVLQGLLDKFNSLGGAKI
jgi:hypothetical protein